MLQVVVVRSVILAHNGAVHVAGDRELHRLGGHRQRQRARHGGCDQFSFHWIHSPICCCLLSEHLPGRSRKMLRETSRDRKHRTRAAPRQKIFIFQIVNIDPPTLEVAAACSAPDLRVPIRSRSAIRKKRLGGGRRRRQFMSRGGSKRQGLCEAHGTGSSGRRARLPGRRAVGPASRSSGGSARFASNRARRVPIRSRYGIRQRGSPWPGSPREPSMP